MKKGIAIFMSLCMMLGTLTACGSKTVQPQETTRVITDHLGHEVTLPETIERVAIVDLLPLPSVLAAYQGGEVTNLVAMPPDALNAAENSILSLYAPDILKVSTA